MMRGLICCWLTIILFVGSSWAANFYVSSSVGDDLNNGTHPTSPIASLDAANALVLLPGDSLLFFSGDYWEGMLWPKYSGTIEAPIVIGKYGGEQRPVINGFGYQACVLIYNNDYIEVNSLELYNEETHLDASGETKKIDGFGGESNSWGSGRDVRFGIKVVADEQELVYFRFYDLVIRDIFPTPFNSANLHKGYGIKLETHSDTLLDQYNTISDVFISGVRITRTGHYGMWIKSLGLNNIDDVKNTGVTLSDCEFEYTGGSGFVPNKSANILVEHCLFNHTGSGLDSRMWNRGSGMWTFDCKNVISQHNSFLNAHGPQDSYGCHIDYGNENVVFQYNFSSNNEGGFVEILGDNVNCGYRYNISVNDGYRLDPDSEPWAKRGKIFWLSNYCGSPTIRCPSIGTFVYNNTVFLTDTVAPEIYVWPNVGDIHIWNNLGFATAWGDTIHTLIRNEQNEIDISHNLFFNPVRFDLDLDLSDAAIFEPPNLLLPLLAGSSNPEMYQLTPTSAAMGAGRIIAGSDDTWCFLENNGGQDFFGNPVSPNGIPNIGAFGGMMEPSFQSFYCGPGTIWDDDTGLCVLICLGDLDSNGSVSVGDILQLLGAWGITCE